MQKKSNKIIEKYINKDNLDDKDINKLCKLSTSNNAEIRRAVAILLGEKYTKESEKVLYKLTFDKEEIVRLEAVDSLSIGREILTEQRLKKFCSHNLDIFRFFGIQSYCDVFLYNKSKYKREKKDLLRILNDFELLETEEAVLAAIYKCRALCDDTNAVEKLIRMHIYAKEEKNFHLITPIYNLLFELQQSENEQITKKVAQYIEKEKMYKL